MVALTFWGSDRRDKVSLTDRIARKVRTRGSDAGGSEQTD
jgi:hypothetical protein